MNRDELKKLLAEEKRLYFPNKSDFKKMSRSKHKRYYIYKYLRYFRLCQYYSCLRKSKDASVLQKKFSKYLYRYFDRMHNIYSYKSGVEIGLHSDIGRCCDIWHSGVVINGIVGDNCVFHGNNIVGNKGSSNAMGVPTLGNYVDVGVGAVIIGEVFVASESVVGANAVVTKDFNENGSVIIGVPGRKIELKRDLR